MSKKLDLKEVKNNIEMIDGYKLISKEYINNFSKLIIKCPENHEFLMSYNHFQSKKHRCPFCQRIVVANKLKHSYENIKNYIESFDGYKLISKKYKDSISKLRIRCNLNHIFEMSYDTFRAGHRCSYCSGNARLTYNYVKDFIEKTGYKLIDKEYKNSAYKMMIECNKGHQYNVCFSVFKAGHRCPICCNKYRFFSYNEKEITNYIKSIYNGKVIENDRKQIFNPKTNRYLELDIWLPELNKAIEYNGEYWHRKDRVKYGDNQKSIQCEQKGIELMVIDEKKWVKNKDFTIIKNFINNVSNVI